MSTQSWSTPIDHTSDNGFRAWGSELSAKLAAAGLVKTADTGQINWATVTRPAANTAAGYEMWRLNDSLSAAYPIFLKVEYGSSTSYVDRPQIWITIGTGSNGTGTITGTATSRIKIASETTLNSTVTPYQSYLCVAEGFVGLLHKSASAASRPNAFFSLERTRNGSGAATGLGFRIQYLQAASNGITLMQCVRVAAPATVFSASYAWGGYVIGSVVGSDDGEGNKQTYLHYGLFPKVLPCLGTCTVLSAEVALGNTFSATLIGETAHTYISLAGQIYGDLLANNSSYALAMLWE